MQSDEPLTDSVDVVRALETHKRRLQAKITANERETTKRFKKIEERIRAGETTGDPFLDYVIVAHGELNPDLEARYREIASSLTGRKGEMVLLEYWQEVHTGPLYVANMVPSRGHEDDEDQLTFYCGLLTSGEFKLTVDPARVQCRLPVSKWVGETHPGGPLENRTLPDSSTLLYPNNKNLLIRLGHHCSITHIVIAGDDAVKKWFAENRPDRPDLFLRCAEMLGKLVLTSESA